MTALALAIVSAFSHAEEAGAPLASVVVTAARVPQAAADVLSDHVLLSAQDIARSGATNVVDLLRLQRGIEVARNGGPGTNASVFLRGGDSKQTVVLVDGVRIGSSTSGIANWSALPLANIERIEIVYGPLATMYGADAIGGVIQLFTRRGAGAPQLAAGVMGGSEKNRSMDASIFGGTERMHFSITAAHQEEEGFSATKPGQFSYNPDKDGFEKNSVTGNMGYRFDERHEAGVLFMASDMDAQYDAGASSFDARGVHQLNNVALYSRHQLTPAWQLRLQASRADDKSQTFANASASGISSLDTRQSGYSVQNDIAIGGDLLQVMLERREEDVVASSTAGLTRERATNSAALSYSLKRGAHLASASARLDDNSQYGSQSTGGIGYGYRITSALRVNASAGTSFRAPTFNELYYPSYGVASNRPEHGRNAEVGLAYNTGAVEATAVYYRNRLKDLLVSAARCPVEVETHPFGCAYNVNRATLSGLSVGARATVGQLELRGTFDLQDPRDETTGKQLVRRARRHGNLSADYAFGAISLGASVHLSGKRFDDLANRNVLPGYGLVNLTADWRFAPDWSAYVHANNVADKRYELAKGYATAGTQYFAGIRYGAR